MQPNILVNKIGVPIKNIVLLCAKVNVLENGCWEWIGAKTKGYGVVKIRALRKTSFIQVHRLLYEMVHGRLEDGAQLHHKVEDGCIGPSCGNPNHLQKTNIVEHTLNLTPTSIGFINSRKTHCPRGHEYNAENTRPRADGGRECRACDREKQQVKRDLLRGDRQKHKKKHLPTHCKRGHELSGDNLYFFDTPSGKQRRCVICQNLRQRAYHQRKRERSAVE